MAEDQNKNLDNLNTENSNIEGPEKPDLLSPEYLQQEAEETKHKVDADVDDFGKSHLDRPDLVEQAREKGNDAKEKIDDVLGQEDSDRIKQTVGNLDDALKNFNLSGDKGENKADDTEAASDEDAEAEMLKMMKDAETYEAGTKGREILRKRVDEDLKIPKIEYKPGSELDGEKVKKEEGPIADIKTPDPNFKVGEKAENYADEAFEKLDETLGGIAQGKPKEPGKEDPDKDKLPEKLQDKLDRIVKGEFHTKPSDSDKPIADKLNAEFKERILKNKQAVAEGKETETISERIKREAEKSKESEGTEDDFSISGEEQSNVDSVEDSKDKIEDGGFERRKQEIEQKILDRDKDIKDKINSISRDFDNIITQVEAIPFRINGTKESIERTKKEVQEGLNKAFDGTEQILTLYRDNISKLDEILSKYDYDNKEFRLEVEKTLDNLEFKSLDAYSNIEGSILKAVKGGINIFSRFLGEYNSLKSKSDKIDPNNLETIEKNIFLEMPKILDNLEEGIPEADKESNDVKPETEPEEIKPKETAEDILAAKLSEKDQKRMAQLKEVIPQNEDFRSKGGGNSAGRYQERNIAELAELQAKQDIIDQKKQSVIDALPEEKRRRIKQLQEVIPQNEDFRSKGGGNSAGRYQERNIAELAQLMEEAKAAFDKKGGEIIETEDMSSTAKPEGDFSIPEENVEETAPDGSKPEKEPGEESTPKKPEEEANPDSDTNPEPEPKKPDENEDPEEGSEDEEISEELLETMKKTLSFAREDWIKQLRERGNAFSKKRKRRLGKYKKEEQEAFDKSKSLYEDSKNHYVEAKLRVLKKENQDDENLEELVLAEYENLLIEEENYIDELASKGDKNKIQKFKAWWKKHSKHRLILAGGMMSIGAGLTFTGVGAAVGASLFGSGFAVARGTMSGMGTFMGTEAWMDRRSKSLGQKGLIDDALNLGFKGGFMPGARFTKKGRQESVAQAAENIKKLVEDNTENIKGFFEGKNLSELQAEMSRLRILSLDKNVSLHEAGRFGGEQTKVIELLEQAYYEKLKDHVKEKQAIGDSKEDAEADIFSKMVESERMAQRFLVDQQDESRIKAIKRHSIAAGLGLTAGLFTGFRTANRLAGENPADNTNSAQVADSTANTTPEMPDSSLADNTAPADATEVPDTAFMNKTVPVDSAEAHAETFSVPSPDVLTEVKEGDTVWGLAKEQIKEKMGAEEWNELGEAKQTYLIDSVKDKIVANPSEYGIHGDVDNLTEGTKINFPKVFADPKLKLEVPKLSEEQLQNIVDNNEALSKAAKAGIKITSENVDQVAAEVRKHGVEFLDKNGGVHDWNFHGEAVDKMNDGSYVFSESHEAVSPSELSEVMDKDGHSAIEVAQAAKEAKDTVKLEQFLEADSGHYESSMYNIAKSRETLDDLFVQVLKTNDNSQIESFISDYVKDQGFSDNKTNIFMASIREGDHNIFLDHKVAAISTGTLDKQISFFDNTAAKDSFEEIKNLKPDEWNIVKVGKEYALIQKDRVGSWPFRHTEYSVDFDGDHTIDQTIAGDDALKTIFKNGTFGAEIKENIQETAANVDTPEESMDQTPEQHDLPSDADNTEAANQTEIEQPAETHTEPETAPVDKESAVQEKDSSAAASQEEIDKYLDDKTSEVKDSTSKEININEFKSGFKYNSDMYADAKAKGQLDDVLQKSLDSGIRDSQVNFITDYVKDQGIPDNKAREFYNFIAGDDGVVDKSFTIEDLDNKIGEFKGTIVDNLEQVTAEDISSANEILDAGLKGASIELIEKMDPTRDIDMLEGLKVGVKKALEASPDHKGLQHALNIIENKLKS